jgi:uncharacterized protein (TIGR02271 family)
MRRSGVVSVKTRDGLQGKIDTKNYPIDGSQPQALITLEDGQEVWIPVNLLEKQDNNQYFLPFELAQIRSMRKSENSNFIVLPVIEEQLKVGKRRVHTGGVRVTKKVHEREEKIDEAGFQEEVRVDRIKVDRILDQPVSVRQEGDTLIIPILEEQLVVEKRLVLKEELHITRLRKEMREQKRVKLRKEEALVERIEPKGTVEETKQVK